jgi:hypothetical protein
VIFKSQEHGFVTVQLFEEWVNKVPMLYYAEHREPTKYTGWGLLMLDGCTCYSLTWLESKLSEKKIGLIVLPPHSSDQAQLLDLGVFAAIKRHYVHLLTVRTYLRRAVKLSECSMLGFMAPFLERL